MKSEPVRKMPWRTTQQKVEDMILLLKQFNHELENPEEPTLTKGRLTLLIANIIQLLEEVQKHRVSC